MNHPHAGRYDASINFHRDMLRSAKRNAKLGVDGAKERVAYHAGLVKQFSRERDSFLLAIGA